MIGLHYTQGWTAEDGVEIRMNRRVRNLVIGVLAVAGAVLPEDDPQVGGCSYVRVGERERSVPGQCQVVSLAVISVDSVGPGDREVDMECATTVTTTALGHVDPRAAVPCKHFVGRYARERHIV